MKRRVFDAEADGLLPTATQVWCIVLKDLNSQEVFQFTNVEEAIEEMERSDILIGHNICGYDFPLFKKLYGWEYKGIMRDTLCMSKLFDPDRPFHNLDSYGKQFGRLKPTHEDWSRYSPEMLHRCTEDVEINKMLYEHLFSREADWMSNWVEPLELEQQFAMDQAQQELDMVTIDTRRAHHLVKRIDQVILEIDKKLDKILPLKAKPKGAEVKKVFKKDGTYTAQVTNWIEEYEH